jgi:sterol desaturase/sphingolipid hydroxylase (fatty acid hydroxylase superfamily)
LNYKKRGFGPFFISGISLKSCRFSLVKLNVKNIGLLGAVRVEAILWITDFVFYEVLYKAGQGILSVITGFFGYTSRLSFLFIAVAFVAAYFAFLHQHKYFDQTKKDQTKDFLRFLKLREVYWHPSAKLDYLYLFINAAINRVILGPLYLVLLIPAVDAGHLLADFLTTILGPREYVGRGEHGAWVYFLYGFVLFVAVDFSHYWVHRLCHASPFLWEFHKIHHAAEVLVPPTALRVHPIEKVLERIMHLGVVGTTCGIFFYLFGREVHAPLILGVNYLLFISNFAAANLRHSHIWLSFGRVVERIFMSPAQHQIHHSTNPKHYNKNLATHLSLWDWMFGTLYLTTSRPETIEFGVGEKDGKNYQTLNGLLFYPFKASFRKFSRKVKKLILS